MEQNSRGAAMPAPQQYAQGRKPISKPIEQVKPAHVEFEEKIAKAQHEKSMSAESVEVVSAAKEGLDAKAMREQIEAEIRAEMKAEMESRVKAEMEAQMRVEVKAKIRREMQEEEDKKPKIPLNVRATMHGFYGNVRRAPGEKFTIDCEKHMGAWMEKI